MDPSCCIDRIALWHFSEWGSLYSDSELDDFEADIELSLLGNQIPQSWVLMGGEDVWGTVSIFENDLPDCPEFSPWLANVYVEPSKRSLGYGQRLVKVAMEFALLQSLKPLFLYTPDQMNFYDKKVWEIFKQDVFQ